MNEFGSKKPALFQYLSSSDTGPPKGILARSKALIREKRTLVFWNSFIPLPIRLSGAELELKMAVFSSNREAKLQLYGIEQVD